MRMYFIIFRSVTPAQRGQRVLTQAGIRCTMQRTPRYMQDRGCGYCLRLRPGDSQQAVEALRAAGVGFSKVYSEEKGLVEELSL